MEFEAVPSLQEVIAYFPDDIPAQSIHPAADLFPMIAGVEFDELVESIRADGLEVPILITDDGQLLDGRNRLLACYMARVDPIFDTRSFSDPWGTVVRLNIHRRHLNVGQRAASGMKLLAHYTEDAEARMLAGKIDVDPSADLRKGRSADQAAAEVGVSSRAIQQFKRVADNAPDLAMQVETGKLALDAAEKEVKKRIASRPLADPVPAVKPQLTKLFLLDGKTMDVGMPKAKSTFNPTNEHISWAAWSWNPVTGCLHGCDYCYAREITTPASPAFPAGFAPAFRPERLDAPLNTKLPTNLTDERQRRVFVCSMADLFGEWVPQEWIDDVFTAANKAPDWDYMFLTKFPQRYKRVTFPPGAWAGTTVDYQKRIKIVERAMAGLVDDPNVAVRWLSIEPLLEPLHFTDLSWCNLMVIGSQTATRQPGGTVPAFAPPFEWVADLVAQARAANVPVYLKPNLVGHVDQQSPGMALPREGPS